MEQQSNLLVDLVVAVSVALAGGWLATRIGLSSIVGYIGAGVVISPFTPGFVGDVDRLRLIADIGVVLLMFGVGVHFSLRDLTQTGVKLAGAATAQVAGVMAAGVGIGLLAGWGRDEALFAGAAIAISSSTVIVKLLGERGEVESTQGRLAVAWSIVEDVCAVVIVAVLIAVTEKGDVATSVGLASLKGLAFVTVVLVLGLRLVPWLLGRVAAIASRELFVLAIAALALGTALGSERAGLSLAFGAFLAGMIVSETELSHRILEELLPARDVFGALFFVSVGMLIDPDVLRANIGVLLSLLGVIVAVKGGLTLVLARAAGYTAATSVSLAALLAQAGEFSFVLAGIGLDRATVRGDVFSLVVAATAISMALTPAVSAGADYVMRRTQRAGTLVG